jgi:hypothetical protein
VHEIDTELKGLFDLIAQARREYFQGQKTTKSKKHLQSLETRARELNEEIASLSDEAQHIAGISDELLESLERESYGSDDNIRIHRQMLVENEVPSTDLIDHELPRALERIYRLVKKDWLQEQRELFLRSGTHLIDSPLSLTRGVRIQSEFPPIHRFAQSIFVCEDYLNSKQDTDIFAAALLVPQTASLGAHLPFINKVGGETDERIQSLWRGKSENVDSTVFELLVAGSCAAFGRTMEFIKPTDRKSPDLRVHDYPFPLVVECKRKRVLSDYEIEEEHKMRELFSLLQKAASTKSMWGIFEIELLVDARTAPLDEIVCCSVRQRLAASPEKVTSYEWGSIAFEELPKKLNIPKTQKYSPLFLKRVFHWNSDLPNYDGIICNVASSQEFLIDIAEDPIAIVWINNSPEAIKKKSWSPLDLFGKATNQIPAGEVGVIYVCYQERSRDCLADSRTESYISRMSEWLHSGAIRLPVTFLIRTYPRPLEHGTPDLIENGIQFMSELYGDQVYFADFPTTVFTLPRE